MKALRGLNARATSPIAVVWLLAVWLLLWGSISPLAVGSGLLIGIGLLWATPQPAVEIGLRFRPLAALSLLLYVTLDLFVSSARVAWQILTPRLPESAIYDVPLRVRGGLMITMVAVAVTAVPGSTVVDARPEDGVLEIHVFDASSPDAEEDIRRDVRVLERRITAAFGSRAERRRVLEAAE
ncbi:MAG TPA: Na+/H+ antiporter subunit E [Actinospica sp.]|nr:Na+/H+ antiporter subunit E [Actinospica sp.]